MNGTYICHYYAYIWLIFMVKKGTYPIHGCCELSRILAVHLLRFGVKMVVV